MLNHEATLKNKKETFIQYLVFDRFFHGDSFQFWLANPSASTLSRAREKRDVIVARNVPIVYLAAVPFFEIAAYTYCTLGASSNKPKGIYIGNLIISIILSKMSDSSCNDFQANPSPPPEQKLAVISLHKKVRIESFCISVCLRRDT